MLRDKEGGDKAGVGGGGNGLLSFFLSPSCERGSSIKVHLLAKLLKDFW